MKDEKKKKELIDSGNQIDYVSAPDWVISLDRKVEDLKQRLIDVGDRYRGRAKQDYSSETFVTKEDAVFGTYITKKIDHINERQKLDGHTTLASVSTSLDQSLATLKELEVFTCDLSERLRIMLEDLSGVDPDVNTEGDPGYAEKQTAGKLNELDRGINGCFKNVRKLDYYLSLLKNSQL